MQEVQGMVRTIDADEQGDQPATIVTARKSEFVRPIMTRQPAKRAPGHHQRHRSQRQIDPEDEGPMQMIRKKTAEYRAKNAGA